MNEFLLRFEEYSLQLNWMALCIPGVISVIMGLILLFVGKRLANIVVGFLGIVVGSTGGFLLTHFLGISDPLPTIVIAFLLGFMFFLQGHIAILRIATYIIVIVGILIYFSFSYKNEVNEYPPQRTNEKINLKSSDAISSPEKENFDNKTENAIDKAIDKDIEKVNTSIHDFLKSITTNRNNIFLSLLGAIIGVILGCFFKPKLIVFSCSIVGAAFIMVGIIVLLLAKQTPVISTLLDRPRLIRVIVPVIFIVITLFGCIVQFLFTKKKTDKLSQVNGLIKKCDHSDDWHNLKMGMEANSVIEILGQPQNTKVIDDFEKWFYLGEQLKVTVTFKHGKVIDVS